MLNLQLAKKYAVAMFELAQEQDKLVDCGEQLKEVAEVFLGQPELRGFLGNPQVATSAKKDLLEKIFGKDVDKTVNNFLCLLVDKHRMSLIEAIVNEFETLSNGARNIIVAQVITAKALSKKQQTALIAKLEAVTGKTVELKLHTRKSIVGGMIVKIGDKLIDGSVTGRIKSLEKQLMAN